MTNENLYLHGCDNKEESLVISRQCIDFGFETNSIMGIIAIVHQ